MEWISGRTPPWMKTMQLIASKKLLMGVAKPQREAVGVLDAVKNPDAGESVPLQNRVSSVFLLPKVV